jgi:hypothetical protein
VSTLWSYFWPILATTLVVGIFAGLIAFRRPKKRKLALGGGLAIALGLAALWHGPLGGAQRLTDRIEGDAQATLDFYELTHFSAHLHRGPLTRHLVLSGAADDFQHTELVRTMDLIPGVSSTGWSDADAGPPLFAEAAATAIAGFLFGLMLAYLLELRRRYNAQWTW